MHLGSIDYTKCVTSFLVFCIFCIYIVACQRGGVSDEPPWLQGTHLERAPGRGRRVVGGGGRGGASKVLL